MNERIDPAVSISIDMKKYRIRIFKMTLHQLGDPPYVQLLINPEGLVVAIKSVSQSVPGDQTHKVPKRVLHSDNCIEIYSRSFITKLKEVVPDLNEGYSYRMMGELIANEGMAVFSLKHMTRIEQ